MRTPKPIRLTLEPWPDPKLGKLYEGLVQKVSESGECISVTLENLDKTMAGCLHCAELPKSLHPGNRTHRFAIAAGLNVGALGAQTNLRDSVGAIVNMAFLPVGDGYEIEFEKVKSSDQAGGGRDNAREHREEIPNSGTAHDCQPQ